MSNAAPPRAVLDADVIFSRVLHELFGRIAAEAGLLSLIWSDELLSEAARSLQRGKGLSEDVAARWVGRLSEAFPDAQVKPSDAPENLDPTLLTDDPADEHVCALQLPEAPRSCSHSTRDTTRCGSGRSVSMSSTQTRGYRPPQLRSRRSSLTFLGVRLPCGAVVGPKRNCWPPSSVRGSQSSSARSGRTWHEKRGPGYAPTSADLTRPRPSEPERIWH